MQLLLRCQSFVITNNERDYMKNCFVITCEYPYITAEAFFESEIGYLSRFFDNVYVFPINASQGDKQTREIPYSNVYVYPLGCIFSKMRYPVYITRGIFTRDKSLKLSGLDLKKKAVSLYAKGRSNYIFNKIKAVIELEKLETENGVFYSYWFTDQAIASWKLRDYFGNCSKAICRAHRYDLYSEINSIGFLPYQDVSLKMLDGVYPCSENGVKYLVKKYPSYEKKIHTARLGTVDHGEREYTVTDKNFVTCCSLKTLKRISLFAKSFCRLSKKYQHCKWVCIGDGDELELINQIVSNSGVGDRVTMLGRLSNTDVIKYYCENDVSYFVNVSTTEGVPVSIMEAMSFGIPAIATDVGGTAEIVSDKNGMIISPELNEDILFDILENEIKISEEEYLQKRKQARLVWEEKSSAENNYTEWCNILTDNCNSEKKFCV